MPLERLFTPRVGMCRVGGEKRGCPELRGASVAAPMVRRLLLHHRIWVRQPGRRERQGRLAPRQRPPAPSRSVPRCAISDRPSAQRSGALFADMEAAGTPLGLRHGGVGWRRVRTRLWTPCLRYPGGAAGTLASAGGANATIRQQDSCASAPPSPWAAQLTQTGARLFGVTVHGDDVSLWRWRAHDYGTDAARGNRREPSGRRR